MPPRSVFRQRLPAWALPAAIAGSTGVVLAITVLCLASHINTVFMHLFYIPLVLIGYYYRKRGVPLILLLSAAYLALATFFVYPSVPETEAAALRTAMFVIIGVLVACLSDHLEQKRTEYESLLANLHDIVFRIDPDGSLVMASPGFARLLGYPSVDECLGKKMIQTFCFRPEYGKQLQDSLERNGRLTRVRTSLRHRDGHPVPVSLSVHRFFGPWGEAEGIEGVFHDVSAEEDLELQLEESEAKFRNIFASISDPIFIHEMDERGIPYQVLEVNDASSRLFGYTHEEFLHKGPFGIISSIRTLPKEEIGQNLVTQGNLIFEAEFTRKDGSVLPVEVNSCTSTLAGKKVVVSVVRDITARKKAEDALKKSEEALRADRIRLANAMDLAHLVDWEFDIGTGMFSFDERFYSLYGTTPEREGGLRMPAEVYVREFVHPEDAGKVLQGIRDGISIADPAFSTQVEHRIVRRDGQVRYISVRVSPIRDGQGNLVRTYGANQDITERKLIEEELRESEHRMQDIIDFLPDPTFVIDTTGKVIFWNRAIQRFTGVTDTEIVGKGNYEYAFRLFGERRPLLVDQVVHPDQEILRKYYHKVQQDGFMFSGQFHVPSYMGRPADLWIIATPLLDREGNAVGAIETIRDISGLKKTEAALRDLNATLEQRVRERTNELENARNYARSLIEADIDPLVLIGTDGRIRDVNRACEIITGREREALVGTTFLEYIENKEQARSGFDEAIHTGHATNNRYAVLHRDGHLTPVLASSAVYRGSDGSANGLIVALHDITRILEDEEKINAQLKEKEVLLREVHHRVKNNLQIIISLMHLQEKLMHEPAVLEALRDTQNRVHAIALVHERLHLSADLGRIDIGDYLQHLAKTLFTTYQADPSRVRLIFEMDEVVVDIDTAAPLGLIFNELISNMLKYAFPAGRKGECRISVHRDDRSLRVGICDNGIGLPPGFDWQNTPSLGLRLVHILTDQVKGTLTLDRTGGTCFTLTVPVGGQKDGIHRVD